MHHASHARIKLLRGAISIVAFLLFVQQAEAAQIYFSASAEEVVVGDTVEVQVLLDSHGARVNAYAATVRFPNDLLVIQEIRESGSIIGPWIDRPAEDASGVSFSGITPGGFSGADGRFFSIVFTAIAPGTAEFSTANDQVLLHNGLGSPAPIRSTHAPVSILVSAESILDILPVPPFVEEVVELLDDTIASVSQAIGGALRDTLQQLPPGAQEFAARTGSFFSASQSYLESIFGGLRGAIARLAGGVRQFLDDPLVEAIAERYVAPAAIGVSVVTVAPSFSNIFIPLLRYLFLQPLLLLGRKKRRAWGQVYNSLTKLPVDLAIVRLIDVTTGRIVQTRVTDAQGRYFFIVPPGSYRIEVQKNGLSFPSAVLRGMGNDREFTDLYFGKNIVVADDGATVATNIPLDPIGIEKPPARLLMQKRIRLAQRIVSLTGVIVTAGTFLITPVWYIAAFLAMHILLYVGFSRYMTPKRPKNWGVISDASDQRPLGKAVIRLFAKEYDKLVDSQVTGKSGRYAFLVGSSTYYLRIEKEGYETRETAPLRVEGAKGEAGAFVAQDVALQRTKGHLSNV